MTFSNTKNEDFKQEFGDGRSAIQNLKITNSKWRLRDGVLYLNFDYSDYSGQHTMENTYIIVRKEQELILKIAK
ncbi:hypothetical protein [Sphingobacterium chuzhouense]|uniref:Uncharacterized protein n=1 Tax=Sphingobacterium chuzhouense TaxID=1742264 RepID=A0ABR7XTD3_9SPHI|nr:hypothetical protein [Sphingobacterium chuzhouense]MBD1421547.1 hypothetical protein [Sphingobacterium chuzhouense]